jgi:hypothetical protein
MCTVRDLYVDALCGGMCTVRDRLPGVCIDALCGDMCTVPRCAGFALARTHSLTHTHTHTHISTTEERVVWCGVVCVVCVWVSEQSRDRRTTGCVCVWGGGDRTEALGHGVCGQPTLWIAGRGSREELLAKDCPLLPIRIVPVQQLVPGFNNNLQCCGGICGGKRVTTREVYHWIPRMAARQASRAGMGSIGILECKICSQTESALHRILPV